MPTSAHNLFSPAKVPKGRALASIFPVQNAPVFTERDVVYRKSKQTALNAGLNGGKEAQ